MRLNILKSKFPLTWRHTIISVLVLSAATVICILMRPASDNDMYALLIFILAVTIISLKTEGYFYGVSSHLYDHAGSILNHKHADNRNKETGKGAPGGRERSDPRKSPACDIS